MSHQRWILALALPLAAIGCDDDESEPGGQVGQDAQVDGGPGDGGAGGDAGATEQLTVATYNAGFAVGFVPYAEERVGVTTAAAGVLPVDVLCGQEFWAVEHRQALYDAAGALPHTFDLPADPGECEPACTAEETDPLQACMDENCPDVPPAQVISCGTNMCGDEVNGLSAECLMCVSGAIGTATVEEIVAACGPEATTASCYAYGGSFGITLLSRYEMAERDSIVFESSLNRRGVLYAKLAGTPVGDVHVFCTHLSAIFSDIPHPNNDEGGSWEAEQRAQIDRMRQWAQEKAGDGQIILLGDFNTGPEVPGVAEAEYPANYEALAAGYDAPFVTSENAACTFCDTNLLVSDENLDHDSSVLIDHVLLKGFEGITTTAERVLDGTVEIQADGMSVETSYSDHYGVVVTISK